MRPMMAWFLVSMRMARYVPSPFSLLHLCFPLLSFPSSLPSIPSSLFHSSSLLSSTSILSSLSHFSFPSPYQLTPSFFLICTSPYTTLSSSHIFSHLLTSSHICSHLYQLTPHGTLLDGLSKGLLKRQWGLTKKKGKTGDRYLFILLSSSSSLFPSPSAPST